MNDKDPKNAQKRFTELFLPEEKEKIFLIKKDTGISQKQGSHLLSATRYLAWVDCDTGELHDECGWLRTVYSPILSFRKPDFRKLGIYRVRVRENRNNPADHLIVKVLGRVSEQRLEAIGEEYGRPVSVTNEIGTFELDRDYDQYSGTVDYLGDEASVSLDVREGKTDAEEQFRRLMEICGDIQSFDREVREYIARDETLWDWLDDGGVSREGFEQRLGVPSLTIDEQGETEVWFDGGEPFGYHSIVVTVDKNGVCTGLDLVG